MCRPRQQFEPQEQVRQRVLQSRRITEFQRRVYLEVLKVPAGCTVTYKQLAERIGCRSPQAVGQALKRNPFAPEVPCHRVVGSDGSLTGYAFGLDRKRQLLAMEKSSTQES